MINLKTGMVVGFCDGDMGIVIDDCIYCHDDYVEINDETLADMFSHDPKNMILGIKAIYRPSCNRPLDTLLYKKYYKDNEIIWKRNRILIGDIVKFTSDKTAKLNNVDKGTLYIYTGKGYTELPDLIIPSLNRSIIVID